MLSTDIRVVIVSYLLINFSSMNISNLIESAIQLTLTKQSALVAWQKKESYLIELYLKLLRNVDARVSFVGSLDDRVISMYE